MNDHDPSKEAGGPLTAHAQDDRVQDIPASGATTTAGDMDVPSKDTGTVVDPSSDPEDGAKLQPKKANMAIITTALGMATFLAAMDVAIVTTELPSIAASLNASQIAYSWIGSAYLLPYSSMVPFWAKTSDVFGRKPALLGANVCFFVGSLICALSKSVAMLIVGRAIQGAGGGGLIVLVNITLGDLVSMRERGKYLGLIGMVWATAAAVGPSIGGALAEKASWRWCFYINLPADGAAFLALFFFLEVHNPRTHIWHGVRAIDWLGTFLIVGAVLMLLLGLQFGGTRDPWDSATVICLIVFSAVAFAVFFVVQWKLAKYPLMPLRLFKRRDTLAVLGVASTHGFAFVAVAYYLPFYFQTGLGVSALQSAVYVLPYALVVAALSIITGMSIRKTGRYLELIVIGMGLATLGIGLFIDLRPYKSWPRIIIFQLIAALGIGPCYQAPLIAMQSKLRPADTGVGTALFSITRNLSSAISVVIGGVIVQNRMKSHRTDFVQAGIPQSVINQIVSSSSSSTSISHSLNSSQLSLVQAAIVNSLGKMWIFYTCLLFLGFVSSFGIGRTNLSRQHEDYQTGLAAEEKNRSANAKNGVNDEEMASSDAQEPAAVRPTS
ncbi:MAG: hypothetical protein M1822_002053 [Bathelium mastoideum]|nr:MAG: hypothetical protein M1822_002053 [Bathelium mastoideum]